MHVGAATLPWGSILRGWPWLPAVASYVVRAKAKDLWRRLAFGALVRREGAAHARLRRNLRECCTHSTCAFLGHRTPNQLSSAATVRSMLVKDETMPHGARAAVAAIAQIRARSIGAAAAAPSIRPAIAPSSEPSDSSPSTVASTLALVAPAVGALVGAKRARCSTAAAFMASSARKCSLQRRTVAPRAIKRRLIEHDGRSKQAERCR